MVSPSCVGGGVFLMRKRSVHLSRYLRTALRQVVSGHSLPSRVISMMRPANHHIDCNATLQTFGRSIGQFSVPQPLFSTLCQSSIRQRSRYQRIQSSAIRLLVTAMVVSRTTPVVFHPLVASFRGYGPPITSQAPCLYARTEVATQSPDIAGQLVRYVPVGAECLLFTQFGSCTVPRNLDGKRTAYLTSPQGIKKLVAAIDKPVVFARTNTSTAGVAVH